MTVPVQVTMDCADPARLAAFWAVDVKAEQLTEQGARVLTVHDQPEREPDYYGVVMQDPEGNEFCLQ